MVDLQAPYQRTRGWYTVSVDTLRALSIVIVLGALATASWMVYGRWKTGQLEQEAAQLIQEVDALLERASDERPQGSFQNEHQEAAASRHAARRSYEDGDFAASVQHGRRARALLFAVLEVAGGRGVAGEAQFIAVQGGVEFRRGEQAEWELAHSRDVLHSGDWVKTAPNGSAEIVFLDGTLHTVRPNTLILVTRERTALRAGPEQAISMAYGWVDLNTAQRGGRVSTPSAQARVRRDSEAAVSVDPASETTRFTAFRGQMDVTSRAGVTKTVGPLEEIRQQGDLLADATALPEAPDLLEPAAHLEVTLAEGRQLRLSWGAVPNAELYALQVSRSRLFVDNLIDVDSRTTTAATLELRGEGNFRWRAAAVGRAGLQGPWSASRSFRVAAALRAGERGDRTPPPLELEQVQVYGNLFIVTGRTEPGASVRINGEAVSVEQSGGFTKTLLVAREGWSVLEFVASDTSGNVATLRQRVFVETL
jgi:hypothetical protein